MLPYELSIACESFIELKEMDIQEKITMVWLGEYYHRIKKLPQLKEVLGKFQSKPKQMTDEQMLNVVKMLNAQFGGTVGTPEKVGE